MAHHEIKILEKYALLHLEGLKPWELRKNNRNYKVGDKITFMVVDENGKYTGKSYNRIISYVFSDAQYGLYFDRVIFSVKKESEYNQIISNELDVGKYKYVIDLLTKSVKNKTITTSQKKKILSFLG